MLNFQNGFDDTPSQEVPREDWEMAWPLGYYILSIQCLVGGWDGLKHCTAEICVMAMKCLKTVKHTRTFMAFPILSFIYIVCEWQSWHSNNTLYSYLRCVWFRLWQKYWLSWLSGFVVFLRPEAVAMIVPFIGPWLLVSKSFLIHHSSILHPEL
jgi:hypothetical protein